MTEIQRVYKKIPSSVCEKGCVTCCTNSVIQFAPEELERVGGSYTLGDKCSFLKEESDGCENCVIYNDRPLVCRLFGSSELLTCDKCKCENPLTEQETIEILRVYNKIRKSQETV